MRPFFQFSVTGIAMCRSARLYLCARCHEQVIICSHCDRGNPYCSKQCSVQSRQEKQRQASARYQSKFKGRQANARRQQQFRQRHAKKVTHQASSDLSDYDLLLTEPKSVKTTIKKRSVIQASFFTCHFCGCRWCEKVRPTFINRFNRSS